MTEDKVDLQRYLEILLRRKQVAFAVFLVIVVIGIVLTLLSPRIYEATILLFPATYADQSQPFPPPSILGSTRAPVVTNPYGYPSTLAEVAQSAAFVETTVAPLGIDVSSLRVRTVWSPDSLEVRLTVRAYTPGVAQRVDEALAAALIQMSIESTRPLRLTLEHQLEQAKADVSRFGTTAAKARLLSSSLGRRGPLTGQDARTQAIALEAVTTADRNYQVARERERLLTEQIAGLFAVRIIGSRPIEVQVAPRKRLNLMMAATLGLLGAVVAVVTTERLNRPSRNRPANPEIRR